MNEYLVENRIKAKHNAMEKILDALVLLDKIEVENLPTYYKLKINVLKNKLNYTWKIMNNVDSTKYSNMFDKVVE